MKPKNISVEDCHDINSAVRELNAESDHPLAIKNAPHNGAIVLSSGHSMQVKVRDFKIKFTGDNGNDM